MAAAKSTPYVGPRPFAQDETALFKGRERETQALCSLVIAHPEVVIHAPSGAGKSSLLNAGLLPKLGDRGYELLPSARVSGLVPSELREEEVANLYVFNLLRSWAQHDNARELLGHDLAGFLASRPHRTDNIGEPVLRVIVLDQFEELFTFAPGRWREREGFFQQLGDALRQDPLLRLVLATREEFVAQLDVYAHLLPHGARMRFHLDPLRADAAHQAIEEPLAAYGTTITPDAISYLVTELLKIRVKGVHGNVVESIGQYVEPVQLQVVCKKLWDRLPDDVIEVTRAHVQTFGDVDDALQEFYEDALLTAMRKTAVSDDRLRAWVDDYLITPGGTRGMVYRGAESTGAEDAAIPNAAVDVLEEEHIIRAESRAGGERWYELTHDRFIGPIQTANKASQDRRARRQRRRRVLRVALVLSAALVAGVFLFTQWLREYERTDGAVRELLALDKTDPQEARRKAPTVLDNVAVYLLQQGELDHLVRLLKLANPVIAENYRADVTLKRVMAAVEVGDRWPVELHYNPGRKMNKEWLQYEWRLAATRLVDTWGIPPPQSLRLVENESLPIDDLEIHSGEHRRRSTVPAVPEFVVVTENKIPPPLEAWFHRSKTSWTPIEALEDGGPWWLVPKWTQPLFEVAGHPTSSREAAVAVAVANTMLAEPQLVLNADNVTYLLKRLEGKKGQHTVAEALAVRGGVQGLVSDLREILILRYPLTNLDQVLNSLADYPYPRYPSKLAAEKTVADQELDAPQGSLTLGRPPSERKPALAEPGTESRQSAAYRDIYSYMEHVSPWPVRVYYGDNLRRVFFGPTGQMRPEVSEALEGLRGDLYRRFGILVPEIQLYKADWDPATKKLEGDAFRIELLNRTEKDAGAQAIRTTGGQEAVKLLINELDWRLRSARAWWITAEHVDQILRSLPRQLEAWLRARYSLTDLKIVLRSVVAEVPAADVRPFEKPDQSLRNADWLLGAIVFWSQAIERADGERLVQALRATQARRLVSGTKAGAPIARNGAVLEGIEALDRLDLPLAEQRFQRALSADRAGAIATFEANYTRSKVLSTGSLLKVHGKVCRPFEKPESLSERRSISLRHRFDLEDFISRHQGLGDEDMAWLQYCLLEHYAAHRFAEHTRATLKVLQAPRYGDRLGADQKFALGYWTLELAGATADPPQELPAAMKWLEKAFADWNEQSEVQAARAFDVLRKRYSVVPRWYLEMLERLGELQPNNFFIAHDLAFNLALGRSAADTDKARVWLERARGRLPKSTAAAMERRANEAWLDYISATAQLTKAEYTDALARKKAVDEAVTQLSQLIARLRKEGVVGDPKWPAADAYSSIISAHLLQKDIPGAAKQVDASISDGLGDNATVLTNYFSVYMASGRTADALRIAERAGKVRGMDPADAAFLVALSGVFTGKSDAESEGRKFLALKHRYSDYVRLMLYWHLSRNGKEDQAKAYLEDRWRNIARDSWRSRTRNGDPDVWREQLIGYFLGYVSRDDIFSPLRDRETFEASDRVRLGVQGLNYEGMSSEAYFYDALLQSVSGDPATRSARYRHSLNRVVELGNPTVYEYLIARYLLERPF